MKLNSNFNVLAYKHFNSNEYITSPSIGVKRFLLDRIGNEQARATTIVEYNPNSNFPYHTHIGGEEFIVLQGTFYDEHGSYPIGTYVRNPIGTSHTPYVLDDGCIIYVKLLQMSDNGDVQQPLYINTNNTITTTATNINNNDNHQKRIQHLFSNPITGENVEMIWIQPNEQFTVDDNDTKNSNGGEELFIIDGSLVVKDNSTTSSTIGSSSTDTSTLEQQIFNKWGWLRFPPIISDVVDASTNSNTLRNNIKEGKEIRQRLHAGTTGVQILRKTGHLTKHALSMEKIHITTDND